MSNSLGIVKVLEWRSASFHFENGRVYSRSGFGHVGLETFAETNIDELGPNHKHVIKPGDPGYYVSFYSATCNHCARQGSHFHTSTEDGSNVRVYTLRLDVRKIHRAFEAFTKNPHWAVRGSSVFREPGSFNCAGLTQYLLEQGGIYGAIPLWQPWQRLPSSFFSRYGLGLIFVGLIHKAQRKLLSPLYQWLSVDSVLHSQGKEVLGKISHLSREKAFMESILARPLVDRFLFVIVSYSLVRRAVYRAFFTITPENVADLSGRVEALQQGKFLWKRPLLILFSLGCLHLTTRLLK